MTIKVVKKEGELLEIEIPGDETLTHLTASFCKDADAAAIRYHPFLTEPKIVVYGKNPKKTILKAIDEALSALEEFKTHFERVTKE